MNLFCTAIILCYLKCSLYSLLFVLMCFIDSFAETGQALVSSVDKIIFVGSPGVGRMVLALFVDFFHLN